VTVKALADDHPARYRDWVEANRQIVHERSGGRVGYVHVPDMGPAGFAEFHRGFLVEYDREALLVDVRFNGGGHVSGLLLEKLARRRLGYDFARWTAPEPYPAESPRGPIVALTNEHSGSDGDIFSHAFKMLGLGPLLGKRTWGGVIGISPSHPLADGTVTTQPEYSFYFDDVGWQVENYGTDPDVEVDNAPQDYARGADPQLERAIASALELLAERPAHAPAPAARPRLAPPPLPPRNGLAAEPPRQRSARGTARRRRA
jgi:tricorn protease